MSWRFFFGFFLINMQTYALKVDEVFFRLTQGAGGNWNDDEALDSRESSRLTLRP
jgi:hypothetical protein